MDRQEIERRARDILRDHGLLQLPIDPLKVAHALEVRVHNAKFSEEDKSGVVTKREGNIIIYLDYDDSPARKRFTIAHEIGHLVLHMQAADDYEIIDTEDNFRSIPNSDGKWSKERKMEWEANTFAAALLMDEELVRSEWEHTKDLGLLAWKFQVSESAMAIRLSSLNLTNEFI
ncbi:MAG: ImmA/IrrE family metallo-endopeptidase [Pseudomonadota bacterium]